MTTYYITRFHASGNKAVIKTELTLEEAQEHCKDLESSSNTCKEPRNVSYTERNGQWFDGYGEE